MPKLVRQTRPSDLDLNACNCGTGGYILFPSLDAFLNAAPSQSVDTSLPVTPVLRVSAFGAFGQDDFKVSDRLTLNPGLRWEYNGVPSEIQRSRERI